MLHHEAYERFERYSGSVDWVEVQEPDGTIGIGTCFHVGDGAWITARHVVEGRTIVGVGISGYRASEAILGSLRGPLNHPDECVDLTALVFDGFSPPPLPLGGHLDDWFGVEFMLSPVTVIGYPPIPFARDPYIVAATGEVNAIIEKPRGVPHPHFILSVMPRGGFSGAPVVHTMGDFLLGVVTESLGRDHAPTELGYLSAITVEPVLVCLGHHGLLTAELREMWGICSTRVEPRHSRIQRRVHRRF